MNNIRSNLWKMYVYKLLSEFYLIVPIIIPFYKSNQLSITEIFIVQSAYCLGVLLLARPHLFGLFSDRLLVNVLFKIPVKGFGQLMIIHIFNETGKILRIQGIPE